MTALHGENKGAAWGLRLQLAGVCLIAIAIMIAVVAATGLPVPSVIYGGIAGGFFGLGVALAVLGMSRDRDRPAGTAVTHNNGNDPT